MIFYTSASDLNLSYVVIKKSQNNKITRLSLVKSASVYLTLRKIDRSGCYKHVTNEATVTLRHSNAKEKNERSLMIESNKTLRSIALV